MIDIGVNLTHSKLITQLDTVLTNAQHAGVNAQLVIACNLSEAKQAVQLCQQYPQLKCTAGVHPHDADQAPVDLIDQLTELTASANVAAIGECGLDFNRNFSTPANQLKVFEQQLALAAQLKLPVYLHQRDAFEPWLALIEQYQQHIPTLISHCFTGTEAELQQCLAHNMYIGITGWVCDERRGQALQQAVTQLPLERLLIETDAPFLLPRNITPKPKQSYNEPKYLPFVAQKIAEIKQVDVATVIEYSRANAQQVFGFDASGVA